MKNKSFREQYKECTANGTVELFNIKEPEVVYLRPNIQGIVSFKQKTAFFCNKYMKRCNSGVCAEERGIKKLNNHLNI